MRAGSPIRALSSTPKATLPPHRRHLHLFTLLCSQADGHPSDTGYQRLAGIVWAASGYARMR